MSAYDAFYVLARQLVFRVERSRVSERENQTKPLKPLQKTCGLYQILAAFANESFNNNAATTCKPLYKNLHQLASQRVPLAA